MAPTTRLDSQVLLHVLLWSLLAAVSICEEDKIPCLQSMKHSHFWASRPFDDTFTSGFVIGFAVSIVSIICIFMSHYVFWMHWNKRNKLPRLLQFMHLPVEDRKKAIVVVTPTSRISYTDLCKATNNFSAENIIGFGQMGTTYKATLSNGLILAVKRLFDTQKFDEHFITELKTLGRMRHNNLVPLLGFCVESKQKLLVYKYMSNGNLYDWLHPVEGRTTKIIEWPLRVKIACGIARGLVWLHQKYNFRVFHLDISSKCILLDQDFEPKISNFGEAVLLKSNNTHGRSTVLVNSWYLEPIFVKEDVYRYGIVLLELITGKDPSKLTNFSNTTEETLNKWVNSGLSTSSNFFHVIDKSLIGRGFDLEILKIFRVACNCVHPNLDKRPTMLEVHKAIAAVGKRTAVRTNNKPISYN